MNNQLMGYEKLKAAVERDCNGKNSCGCFNPNGCSVEHRRKDGERCTHAYCDKFKWVINRAKHYGEKLGLDWQEVLNSWEAKRDYWYMNYYQEANQPRIGSDHVRVFETVGEMLQSIGDKGFRCPMCREITKNPYRCDTGLEMSKGEICDWKVYGLFGDLDECVFVYCKDRLRGERIFMPISWETAEREVSALHTNNTDIAVIFENKEE